MRSGKIKPANKAEVWTAGEPVMRDVSALVPYAGNPKDHPRKQIEALARFIQEVGFRFPIAIDECDVIIAGHGRLLAAQQLGLAAVPCIRHVGLSDEDKRKLRIADNRIAEIATTNAQNLASELQALSAALQAFDPATLGCSELDLQLDLGGVVAVSAPKPTKEQRRSAAAAIKVQHLDPSKVQHLDPSKANPTCWIQITLPLRAQPEVLDRLREVLAGIEGVNVNVNVHKQHLEITQP